CFCFFFFQAEDGIRDYKVTGVQTCALPILATIAAAPGGLPERGGDGRHTQLGRGPREAAPPLGHREHLADVGTAHVCLRVSSKRSEERRVGKECRGGWGREE